MRFAAEFGTGQVLWSILWFFLFVLWIWLLVTIFADLIRNRDLSGWGKAARTPSSPSEQLTQLADLHAAGTLSDTEYAQAKAKVIAG